MELLVTWVLSIGTAGHVETDNKSAFLEKKKNHNFDTNQEVNVTIPIYKFFILYHTQIHVCYIQLQAVHFLKMAHILQ